MDKSPGIKALNTMKEYQNKCVEFKTPEIPRKRKKPKILTEERYIEELSNIIQRDFFPDLARLKAQNEYLDAIEKKDLRKLREIYAKYSNKRPKTSREQSPATFETPVSNANTTPRSESEFSNFDEKRAGSTVDKKSSILANDHSLDSFLSKYTSEDNSSFQEIIDAADAKMKQKFAILYNHETISADKLAKALILPNIEEQFTDTIDSKEIQTWPYKNKNYIMYIPDGVDFTAEEKMEMANRKQEIIYGNTRLNTNPFNENQKKEAITELAKLQAKNLNGKIGVDGNVLVLHTNNSKISDFDFVKTPSPCPGESETPLMTWGEIEGTPFRLDGSDTPIRPSTGPCFRINQASRRETIALELADKARERMRDQKQKALNTARKNIGSPYLRSTNDRLASMSPAAKRLATMKLNLRTSLITPSTTRSVSKSPSPIIRKKSSVNNTQSIDNLLSSPLSSTSDLTNDLLKIPSKRTRASDFF